MVFSFATTWICLVGIFYNNDRFCCSSSDAVSPHGELHSLAIILPAKLYANVGIPFVRPLLDRETLRIFAPLFWAMYFFNFKRQEFFRAAIRMQGQGGKMPQEIARNAKANVCLHSTLNSFVSGWLTFLSVVAMVRFRLKKAWTVSLAVNNALRNKKRFANSEPEMLSPTQGLSPRLVVQEEVLLPRCDLPQLYMSPWKCALIICCEL